MTLKDQAAARKSSPDSVGDRGGRRSQPGPPPSRFWRWVLGKWLGVGDLKRELQQVTERLEHSRKQFDEVLSQASSMHTNLLRKEITDLVIEARVLMLLSQKPRRGVDPARFLKDEVDELNRKIQVLVRIVNGGEIDVNIPATKPLLNKAVVFFDPASLCARLASPVTVRRDPRNARLVIITQEGSPTATVVAIADVLRIEQV